MNKRRILVVSLAVCLIAILAFTSIAVFTDSKTVTNVFKATSGDGPTPPQPEDIFGVKLYETDITKNEGITTKGNTYEEILPAQRLTKDPTVENTGIHPEYVRLIVTVDNAAAWQAACARHKITDLATIFNGFNKDWERKSEYVDEKNDTLTYVYYLNTELAPKATSTLFESVTIPADFDVDDMVSLASFNLTVEAQAIQSEHIGCDNAFDAFAKYWD